MCGCVWLSQGASGAEWVSRSPWPCRAGTERGATIPHAVCLQEKLSLQRELHGARQQLLQQAEYCTEMGAAACTLLWGVSSSEDVVKAILGAVSTCGDPSPDPEPVAPVGNVPLCPLGERGTCTHRLETCRERPACALLDCSGGKGNRERETPRGPG